jgi:GAF domain-containing protein
MGLEEDIPEELQRFIEAINEAYMQSDEDRALLERSLDLTSQELLERNEQLRSRREELEQMVSQRTSELEARNIYLQTAAEVAQDASTKQDLDELLENTVTLVGERFDFYHTAIYLNDDRGEFALLMAATGEIGGQLIEEEYHLRLDVSSLVGKATMTGEPGIAEFGDHVEFDPNPLFPETRAELALPLRAGDQIIGVLNTHSSKQLPFEEGLVSILQTLADQLAVAISNTKLLTEMNQTLRELEVATGSYTQKAWQSVARESGRSLGFRYRGVGIEPITEDDIQLEEGDAEASSGEGDTTKLSIPIRLRDQVIGSLNLRVEEEQTLPETTALAESVAERMALAMENARLLEETQRRVEQEQMVAEVSAKMRQTLDLDTVLRSAATEMRAALGLNDVTIRLEAPSESSQNIPNTGKDNGGSPNEE